MEFQSETKVDRPPSGRVNLPCFSTISLVRDNRLARTRTVTCLTRLPPPCCVELKLVPLDLESTHLEAEPNNANNVCPAQQILNFVEPLGVTSEEDASQIESEWESLSAVNSSLS